MIPGSSEQLPTRFPIFPLSGAVLLPTGNMPLNIFEPRYLQMVRDAMKTDRVIGMIQPRNAEDNSDTPAVFGVGCAGYISNFDETDDGRYIISLTGVCRFDIANELDVTTPYRQVVGDFSRWRQDLAQEPPPENLRPGLVKVLGQFFEQHDIDVDWQAIEKAPLSGLVTSLAMICPFNPSEKQALLEATSLEQLANLLIALIQMSTMDLSDGDRTVRH